MQSMHGFWGIEHEADALGQALDVGDAAFDVDVERRPDERDAAGLAVRQAIRRKPTAAATIQAQRPLVPLFDSAGTLAFLRRAFPAEMRSKWYFGP